MNNLVGLIVAIALGAILTAATYMSLGTVFTDQNVKARANQALDEIDGINNAVMAYITFNGSLKVGFSDPNNDGDYSDSDIFRELEDEGYIKSASQIVDSGGYFLDKTTMSFAKIIQDEDICLQVNYLRKQHPKEGLTVGYELKNYGTITANDLVGKLPKCGTSLANQSVCCAKE
jgi:hypothetical protein